MKIAYVTTHFPFGKAEAFFASEVRSLQRCCGAVYVIATRPLKKESDFPSIGAQSVYMPMFGADIFAAAWREIKRHPRAVARELAAVLRPRYRPAAKLKNVLLFAKGLALADKIRELGIEHIHAQWLTTSASVAHLASRLTGVPWSCTAHQHDIFFDNMIGEKAEHAAFIRVISARNQRHLLERIDPDIAYKTHVVHLGVEVPETYRMPTLGERIELVCAARLEDMKGHRYLLDALRYVKDRGIDVHCTFAGDGYLRPALHEKIVSMGLAENVTMRGIVAHHVLLEELRNGKYDVAVIASTEDPGVHEGIPVAIMESMAAAVPCICTSTGSLDELIDDRTGILVPQRDVSALGDAIVKVAIDPALRLTLGRRARARIIQDFNSLTTSAQLFALIAESDGVFGPAAVSA